LELTSDFFELTDDFIVSIAPEIIITEQPTNKVALLGGESTFGVTPEGLTFSYQWRKKQDEFNNRTAAHGLGSNLCYDVYESAGLIYLATNGGLSISSDGGETFTNKTTANSGLVYNTVYDVNKSNGVLYVSTYLGLSISTDGGDSFSNKTTTNTNLLNNKCLSTYELNGTLYVATDDGLSISTDGGNTYWNRTEANGLGNHRCFDVFVKDGIIYVATLGGLSISTDGGSTFINYDKDNNGLASLTCNAVHVSGGIIYVATGGGLSMSTDGASTFVNRYIEDGLASNNLTDVYVSNSIIYVATQGGFSVSQDGGASFTSYTSADGLASNTCQGIFEDDGATYIATFGGISILENYSKIPGQTASTLTVSNITAEMDSNRYFVEVWNTETGCLKRSDTVVLEIVDHATWNGSTDTDWNTTTNWDVKALPKGTHSLVIPDVTNNPEIAASDTASCANLTIATGASLTIKSDASGTGSLITNGTITNNGTVNIERYISDDAWHLISVPNNTTTANTFVNDYLQDWDETTATWSDIVELSTPLLPAKGYGLWPSGAKATTYNFTGTPNTGNQSQAVTFTQVTGTENNGANLLGNPYPSSIDWSGFDDTWGAVYYYNSTAYVSWNDGSGSGSQYVPPMQGFFIVANQAGTFQLTNEDRVHSSQSYYKSTKNNNLVLESTSNGYSDKLYIRLDGTTTEGFDHKHDAYKFQSGTEGLSELYSFASDKKLSIDVRQETDVFQLGFNNTITGIYNIGINDLADISEVILEDTKAEVFHDLQKNTYQFFWNPDIDNEKRFKLHLGAVGIEETITAQSNILIYAADQEIFIKGAESGKVMVSDMLGRIVLHEEITGSVVFTLSAPLETGMYVVSIIDGKNIDTEKIFIY